MQAGVNETNRGSKADTQFEFDLTSNLTCIVEK
jgi:hypothetical protein